MNSFGKEVLRVLSTAVATVSAAFVVILTSLALISNVNAKEEPETMNEVMGMFLENVEQCKREQVTQKVVLLRCHQAS